VLAAAAVTLDRRLVLVALLAFATYTLPHTVFHGLHLDGFTALDAVLQTAGFLLQLAITVGVLALTLSTRADGTMPARHEAQKNFAAE
jgi:hypothetical protein